MRNLAPSVAACVAFALCAACSAVPSSPATKSATATRPALTPNAQAAKPSAASGTPTASSAAAASGSPVVIAAATQVTAAGVMTAVVPGTLTGTVSYRERIALPPDSAITVRLLDVSRLDAPAVIVAEQVIKAARGVPAPFELKYEPKRIDPKNTYIVSATIADAAGRIQWVTDTRYPVLTNGAPGTSVGVTVVQTSAAAAAPSRSPLSGVLMGSVTYLQRTPMPPNAVVSVQLQDVSRVDAPARVVAQQIITSPAGVPVPYALTYDPGTIDARNRYAVRAEIRSGGVLVYTTDRAHFVLTQGAAVTGVDVILTPVTAPPAVVTPARPPAPVTATTVITPVTPSTDAQAIPNLGLVSGMLTFRERIALPGGTVFSVKLLRSAAGAAAETVIEQSFTSPSAQMPVPFNLPYYLPAVGDGVDYALEASIRHGNVAVFRTAERVPLPIEALRRGGIDVGEVMLAKVGDFPPGVAASPAATTATLTGTVTYRERIALPQGSVLAVSLVELNSRGGVARTLARGTSFTDAQVPLPFSLTYDPAKIDPRKRYGVVARLTAGRSIWTNTVPHAVLSAGKPGWADITLRKIR